MDEARVETAELAAPVWARRRRFDVDAYHRMVETGILGPEDRIELIDGEIIEMAAIGSPHIGTVFALNRLLVTAAADRAIVSVQSPIRLGRYSEPEPDVALLRPRADRYRAPPPPAATDVLLVIEVADSSLRFDREVKLPLYARHAIPEVWIVDLEAQAIDVHRMPDDGRFAETARMAPGATLAIPGLPSQRLAVSDALTG